MHQPNIQYLIWNDAQDRHTHARTQELFHLCHADACFTFCFPVLITRDSLGPPMSTVTTTLTWHNQTSLTN